MLISIITGSNVYAQGVFVRDLSNGKTVIRIGNDTILIGRRCNPKSNPSS